MADQLVFSRHAADEIASSLSRAKTGISDLAPSAPGDLGSSDVTDAGQDLYALLSAFGGGLVEGVANSLRTINAAGSTIEMADKQLEATTPTIASETKHQTSSDSEGHGE